MTAATLERPSQANGQATGQPPPLWGDIPIPIIVGTGEFGQGKTLFGLTICPGADTLVYDNEGSSLTYQSIDFDHVDMAMELTNAHPKGYTAAQRYLWWREDAIKRGRAGGRNGRYRVLMTDPVSEIEDGMAEHIRKNITQYGLTEAQCNKSAGLFWGVMKREWKALLDQLRVLYETVYLVVHMRDQFVGNAPSGRREPKGKETLFELASLFLEFERVKDAQGNVSAVPSAKVLKHRLMRPVMADGEMHIIPIVPPRLPRATPKAIREYVATPPDYDKLKAGERVKEQEFTEEQKLRLQAQIESDRATAAQADLSRIERMQNAAAAQASQRQAAVPAPDASGERASQVQANAAERALVASDQVQRIVDLFILLFGDQWAASPDLAAWIKPRLTRAGVNRVGEMSPDQASGLEAELTAVITARQSEPPFDVPQDAAQPTEQAAPGPITEQQKQAIVNQFGPAFGDETALAAGLPPILAEYGVSRVGELDTVSADSLLMRLRQLANQRQSATGETADTPGSATAAQVERLRALAERTGWNHDAQVEWLKQFGVQNMRGLSFNQADAQITHLAKVEKSFGGGAPGN